MDYLLELFYSEHGAYILDVDLQMLQALMVVSPSSKVFTVSNVLLHKDGRENVAVTNGMSHFCMLVPTKTTVKIPNRNMGHAQGIGIILCCFPKFSIIYPVEPV